MSSYKPLRSQTSQDSNTLSRVSRADWHKIVFPIDLNHLKNKKIQQYIESKQ